MVDIPRHTRLTTLLLPPYGLAWIWAHKKLTREVKMFTSIGVGIYMMLCSVLVFILLFFFTPFGGGWVTFEPAPYRQQIRSLKPVQEPTTTAPEGKPSEDSGAHATTPPQ